MYPSPCMTGLFGPGVKFLSHLQCKDLTFTCTSGAAVHLTTLAPKHPFSQALFLFNHPIISKNIGQNFRANCMFQTTVQTCMAPKIVL
jgi:hypothetical protein